MWYIIAFICMSIGTTSLFLFAVNAGGDYLILTGCISIFVSIVILSWRDHVEKIKRAKEEKEEYSGKVRRTLGRR